MINTLLGMTLAGSTVLMLWRLTDRLLRRRLPARWSYRILKASLVFLLVPVGRLADFLLSLPRCLRPISPAAVPSLPAAPSIPVTVLPRFPAAPAMSAPIPTESALEITLSLSAFRILILVWAAGAIASLFLSLLAYIRFRRRFLSGNRKPASPEAVTVFQACRRELGLLGRASLMENPSAASPFTTGLLHPIVVIPANMTLSVEELRCLFFHELTHIRCGDLWVKTFVLLAKCVHWFNPLIRLLDRCIQDVSEQSCDERTVVFMGQAERYAYGSVILKFASGGAVNGSWAASLSTREAVERRLKRVLNVKKLKKRELVLVLALSAALLIGGTAAALAAKEPLGTAPVEIPASDGKTANNPAPVPSGTASGVSSGGGAIDETGVKTVKTSVSVDGHPSEAFLKELREYFGAPADAPVLFGNHDLILSRGGVLLPDEELSSYCMNGTGAEAVL